MHFVSPEAVVPPGYGAPLHTRLPPGQLPTTCESSEYTHGRYRYAGPNDGLMEQMPDVPPNADDADLHQHLPGDDGTEHTDTRQHDINSGRPFRSGRNGGWIGRVDSCSIGLCREEHTVCLNGSATSVVFGIEWDC